MDAFANPPPAGDDPADRPLPAPWPPQPGAWMDRLQGVITDIDDTLTRDGTLDPAAGQALADLAARGWPVIAVTGRPAGWGLTALSAWPLLALVAENGSVLMHRQPAGPSAGERITVEFADDATTRAAHAARREAVRLQIAQRLPQAQRARDSDGRITDLAIDHSEHAALDAATIAEAVRLMREAGLTATVSSIHINAWLGEHDKATGAAWAVQRCLGMAFDPARWIAVGDSANDEALFAGLPHSVGVANIARWLPAMRQPPAWITSGERGQGFAQVAAALPMRPASRV